MAKKIKADQFETTGTDAIRTSTGPTDLAVGAIADGEYLKRSGSTVVGGIPPGGTTAEALGTTGADVDVGSAAPPTAGQILKASSPTAATWQDETTTDVDAIHDNVAGEINAIAAKSSVVAGDILLIEDSEATNVKKKATISGLRITESQITDLSHVDPNAIHDNVAAEISAVTEKASPVSADLVLIEDSEDSNNKKRVQVGNLPGGGGGAISQYIGTGRWEFVDQILVGSDVTSVAFGSGGDGEFGAALDGDVDEAYLVEFYLPNPGGTADYSLRPNASTADQAAARHYAGSSHGVATTADMKIADGFTSRLIYGSFVLQAKTGVPRILRGSNALVTSPETTTGVWNDDYAASWDDTSTNITSLVLYCSLASGIKTGAWVRLYRRSSNLGNAVSYGALEFLDRIVVQGSAVQSVSFGSSGDGDFLRPLDGDVDEEYIIITSLVRGSASGLQYLHLRPNGASTDVETSAFDVTDGSTGGAAAPSLQVHIFNTAFAAGSIGYGECCFRAKSGQYRAFFAQSSSIDAGINSEADYYGGGWLDTSANVTSLELRSDVASGIGVGSEFKLYRRTQQNIRADAANSYERNVEATVAQGTNSEVEYTTGHATYQGSAIGLSVSLNDTVTAGSITVNLKVGGSTVLTTTLDTTNTSFNRAIAGLGSHRVLPGDEIKIGIATTTLTTTGGGTPGITVNATLSNSALIQPFQSFQVESNIWVPPEIPNAEDDEFDSATLSGWTTEGTSGWSSATPPNALAKFTGSACRYSLNNQRRSWLRFQPPADSSYYRIHKTFDGGGALPDGTYWTRLETMFRNGAAIIDGDGSLEFGLSATSGGVPDITNALRFWLSEVDTGATSVQIQIHNNSGTPTNAVSLLNTDGYILHVCYLCVIKDGNDFYSFVRGEGAGAWKYIFKHTYTGGQTINRIYLGAQNGTQNDPGNMQHMIDFFRYNPSQQLP